MTVLIDFAQAAAELKTMAMLALFDMSQRFCRSCMHLSG